MSRGRGQARVSARRRVRASVGSVLLWGLLVLIGGCGLGIPTDPDGTLERVRGGVLRVGVSVNEPWTAWPSADVEPSGIEPQLVHGFADQLDAEVEWTRGGEESLMRRLETGDLDLVIGGLTSTTPWETMAAITAVYTYSAGPEQEELGHVMATVLGENAFLVELEQFLRAQDVHP